MVPISTSLQPRPRHTQSTATPSGFALLVLFAGLIPGNALFGQVLDSTSIPATPAADSTWPLVNVNVLVTDHHGTPQKIDQHAFQLFEDGTERPLNFPDSPGSAVSLALVIDSSGSTFKQSAAVRSAVTAIIQGMPSGSEVMVTSFSSVAFLDLPFTPVSKVDFSFLDPIKPWGPTALYDAIFATESYLALHANFARRALVIVSDGQDNASHNSIRTVFWKMQQPGSPIVYSCLTSKGNILQSELMAGHINMRFLARRGGGIDFNLDPDPASTAAQIVAAVRSQYVLQFTAADPASNGKARKVAARLPLKNIQVHSLPIYFAPREH